MNFAQSAGNVATDPGARRDIGEAAAIIRDVNGRSGTALRRLSVQDRVYSNERISAGGGSMGQFEFLDDTRLVVGPNSSVVLDRFVYDADRSARQVSLSAVKGTFRFITGNSGKDAYKIRTPTVLMGVRGTVFDVHIDPGGRTSILLLEGEVDACDRSGKCMTLDNPCEFVQIDRGRRAGQKQDIRRDSEARSTAQKLFPFLMRADLLASGFRAAATRCAGGNDAARESGSPDAKDAVAEVSAPEPAPEPGPDVEHENENCERGE